MGAWISTQLGQILPFRYGKGLPERERSKTGEFRVVSSAGFVDTHKEALTTGPAVVVGRKGSIGTLWYSKEPVFPIDTTFWVEGSDDVDLRFAYYLLHTVPLSSMNNDSAVPGLNRVEAESLDVDLPPLSIQRGIAATLGALDDKIDSSHLAIRKIDELVRAEFDRLFSVEQDKDGVPISELLDVNRRRRLTKGTPATYVGMSALPEFFPAISSWAMKEVGSGQKFQNGDVLMARITPCLENGKTAVVDMLHPDEVGWGSTEYVVLSPQGEITTPWIYSFVRHETVRQWAIQRMTGSSGRQRFDAGGFDDYCIDPPSTTLLVEFNAIAQPLFERITQFRDEANRLAALRDVLLPELLSGRIQVPEANEAVEEALV